MYILEFCLREFEGTWSNVICISKDENKLKDRAMLEQVNYLKENGEEYFKDFQVGFLENIINKKKKEIRQAYSEEEKAYIYNGIKLDTYQKLNEYLIAYGIPFAKELDLDEKMVKNIVNDGFYESKSYQIREVEEI